MFRAYVRLITFAFGLLVGMQLPAFIDQYQKRVDAHLIEATQNFEGFQRTADRHFHGDVEAMIAHHAQSPDPVFHEDAESIRQIWSRIKIWRTEMDALSRGWLNAAWHIAFFANAEVMRETRSAFTHAIPLTQQAILSALCVAFLLSFIIELLLVLIARSLRIETRV
jgi:hypothetical protein